MIHFDHLPLGISDRCTLCTDPPIRERYAQT